MYITRIKISNFRGIDVEIGNLDKDFLIMGKNDSGKSNICYALRKVLDYNVRRNPLTENDSSNFNKEKINIEISFSLESISTKNLNALANYPEIDENGKYILNVYFEAVFNSEMMVYEEKLFFGSVEREEKSAYTINLLDKVLDIIYINPNYDLDSDKKYYFRSKRECALKNEKKINPALVTAVQNLNKEITNDEDILSVIKNVNNSDGLSFFEDTSFEVKSNVDVSNIYKSLDIFAVNKHTKQAIGVGDGKNKALSLLLQKASHLDDKQKIYIVEEPENHLFPLLQKTYVDIASGFGADQLIFTTHSPFIVDFKKIHQMIKLHVSCNDGKRLTRSSTINVQENDFSKYGYLMNSELAEMFFYDKVLLVEGFSEKYFYNLLYISDGTYRRFADTNHFGVFAVNGIAFANTKELLEKLGITVYIKTDNDIFKKKGYYAGLSRCFDCLNEEGKKEIIGLLNKAGIKGNDKQDLFKTINQKELDTNMSQITRIYYKNRVFISNHNEGFEKDFLDFVGSKNAQDIDELREAKLKNLHSYIDEKKIVLAINEKNKDNILVRFVSDESK